MSDEQTEKQGLQPCVACGYEQWMSHSRPGPWRERLPATEVRIECGQCGVSLSGWCADLDEAEWTHRRSTAVLGGELSWDDYSS